MSEDQASGAAHAGLSGRACLEAISTRLAEAAAVARAAVTYAEAGSEREAVRIALDLGELLSEATTLHGAMRLIGRMPRSEAERSGHDYGLTGRPES